MRVIVRFGVIVMSCLLLALPLLAACGDDDNETAPTKKTKFTIGNLTDITGVAAESMTKVDVALDDLVRYFNEENLIPGAELEVVDYDTQYDPSRAIPGWEWLKERGADVIVTGLPPIAVTNRSLADKDKTVFMNLSGDPVLVNPPGWAFVMGASAGCEMMTILKWVAEHDWDYKTKGPAKLGSAGWDDPIVQDVQTRAEEYCKAHPDQFEWVGGYRTAYSVTWGPEVEKLSGCDYVLPPMTGIGFVNFIKEMNAAGSDARYLCSDAQPSYLGMMIDGLGWDGFDGMLFMMPSPYWGEDYETSKLMERILDRYHTGADAEALKMSGTAYAGAWHMFYGILLVVKECLTDIGPENFSQEALYNTAVNFTGAFVKGRDWGFNETKREAWNWVGIFRANAADQRIVREKEGWAPIICTP